jgi:L-fuconolactonase
MRIDAHQHFWQLGRFAYPWMPDAPSPLRQDYLPEMLGPALEDNRMDGCVTVQATTDAGEAEWLLGLAGAHPFILGVVAWVDLTDPRIGDRLDALQRHPRFKGVRHPVHDEADDRWLLRPDVLRGLRELARRSIPFDLLLRPQHLDLLPEFADQVPGLPLVLDHIAKPPIARRELEPWATSLERAAQIPHLHVKLSGMVTEADWERWSPEDLRPYIHHVFHCFPPDRLMFGSDWPVCRLANASWKQVLATFTQACGPIPTPARAAIIGGTAATFYRLGEPTG